MITPVQQTLADIFYARSSSRTNYDSILIPEYQRSYRWGPETIKGFIENIEELVDLDPKDGFFGAILVEAEENTITNNNHHFYRTPSLIDGQQRLTTSFLILSRILLARILLDKYDSPTNRNLFGYGPQNYDYPTEPLLLSNPNQPIYLKNIIIPSLQKGELGQALFPLNTCFISRISKSNNDNSDLTLYQTLLSSRFQKSELSTLDEYKNLQQSSNDAEKNNSCFSEMLTQNLFGIKQSSLTKESFQKALSKYTIKAMIYQHNIEIQDANISQEDSHLQKIKEIDKNTSAIEIAIDYIDQWLSEYIFQDTIHSSENALVKIKKLTNAFLSAQFITLLVYRNGQANSTYALNVFHALNTGGTPLTALEAFKSWASVQLQELTQNVSKTRKIIDNIYNIHPLFENPKGNKQVLQALVDAKYLSTGSQLKTSTSQQLQFLKDVFNNNEGRNLFLEIIYISLKIRAYSDNRTQNLYNLLTFTRGMKAKGLEEKRYIGQKRIHEIFALYLDVIHKSLRQTISTPIFIYAIHKQFTDSQANRLIKPTIAFTVLWRLYTGGTSGIDNAFRKVYTKWMTIPYANINERINSLIDTLKQELILKIGSKDKWTLELSEKSNFHKGVPYSLEKLFFIVTMTYNHFTDGRWHNTLTRDNSLLYPWKTWKTQDQFDLEHIAPDIPSDNDWGDVYSTSSNNRLGNMTLIYKEENRGILTSQPWLGKKIAYTYISKENEDSRMMYIQKITDENIANPELLGYLNDLTNRERSHVSYVDDIITYDEWNSVSILNRGLLIAETGYDTFMQWLDKDWLETNHPDEEDA